MLLRNTIVYTLGNLAPRAIGFVLLPVYSAVMSPAEYGIIGAIGGLYMLLSLLVTLAIDRSVFRLYWDYKTEPERRVYLGTIIIGLLTVAALVSMLLLLPLRPLVEMLYGNIPFHPYYTLAIGTAALGVIAMVPKTWLQLKQRAVAFTIISLLELLLNAGLILWWVVAERQGAVGYFKAQFWATLVLVPYFLWLSWRIAEPKFKVGIFVASLRFSAPVIPNLISAWLMNMANRVFLDRYATITDIGFYSFAYQLASVLIIICGAFNQAYSPVFYETAASANQVAARQRLTFFNNLFALVVVWLAFAGALVAHDFIELCVNVRYLPAAGLIPLLLLGMGVDQIGGLAHYSIYQCKRTDVTMWLQMGLAVINLALNCALIPIWGVWGAAWAAILTAIVGLAARQWASRRFYHIPLHILRLIAWSAACVAVVVGSHYLHSGRWYTLVARGAGALLPLCGLWFFWRAHQPLKGN
jgi:O-antigen/teichoic acid export membrane protein